MITFTTAGESHGPGLVVVVEGLPAGLPIDTAKVDHQLWRRQQGYGRGGRMKIETDQVEVVAGVRHSHTIGSPVAMVIRNRDWENWTETLPVEDYPGSEEKRKNLVNLAMAYMGLAGRRRRIPPLILVGPGSHWAQGGSIMGPQIRAVGYLETIEIRALMAASVALVLPSLEEGFGLPVAEAMAAGLPVVCSRGSALEEVAGDAATLERRIAAHSRRQRRERRERRAEQAR